MQAIDDYINGNLTDAKRRAKKAGRNKVFRALRDEYCYSTAKAALIEAYLFDHVSFALTCERLHALDQQDIDDGFIQEKVGKPFTTNHPLVESARHGQALSEPVSASGIQSWRFATSPSYGVLPFNLLVGECIVAMVAPCSTTGSGIDDEQVLRMIEAAPDLLVELEAVIPKLKRAGYGEDSMVSIRAAIAKAQPPK